MENHQKGLLLVLLTAVSSGIAIFLNAFAVAKFDNAFVFTFLKNAVVALALASGLLFLSKRSEFSRLSLKHLLWLVGIGLVGGCAAFLLYFFALKNSNALTAGLLHKTLFVWASAIAFVFLKEKLDARFLVAAALILLGNVLLFWGSLSFGFFEVLILLAVLLWSIENAGAKRLLGESNLSGLFVGFGRMFFGSVFLLLFLLVTDNFSPVLELSVGHWQWIAVTSAFLLVYVASFYSGLKWVPLHQATALLSLGQPVTALLSFVFLAKSVSVVEAAGLFLLLVGGLVVCWLSLLVQNRFSSAWPVSA